MPIVANDIVFRLSGGASNADPLLAVGGAKSSVAVVGSTIFDTVSGAESASGDVEYRCIYPHNAHTTLSLDNAVAWLTANTPSATTTVEIGVGSSAVNATEQSVANESTAPTGITFLPAASKGAGAAIGNIPAGQHRAIWLRRTVNAGTVAAADTFTLRVEGDTAA